MDWTPVSSLTPDLELPRLLPSGLQNFLSDCDARCDSDALPARVLHGQGYHTTVPNGTMVRPTRDAMDYALALFTEGGDASNSRASQIVQRVLPLQDQNPCNRTFGLWPWFFEESVAEMRPADWNWADFIGVRLAHVLGQFGDRLPRDLKNEIKSALHNAALSIFRRNMGPDYTNIAVKGGVVAVMAGEQLDLPFLVDYGRERLARFLEHTQKNGGFTEYNSPPYGALVVVEVERGLLLIKDAAVRASLTAIHRQCWRAMAGSLHLPTGQLCGPHARAYDNMLSATHTALLSAELGMEIFAPSGLEEPHEGGRDFINLLLVPRLACPEDIRRDILVTPAERFVKQDYVRSVDPEAARRGTMWFDGDVCMGSVNVENLWQQRRPVVAYWKVDENVAMLRVRLTHGGADFASGVLRTIQDGPELLSLCSLVTNKADSHDHMDMPADGVFCFDRLALGIELTALDARVSGSAETGFELSAGGRTVSIRPMHAEFGEYTVTWEPFIEQPGKVSVRAVVNGGNPVALVPAAMRNVGIGFHLAFGTLVETAGVVLNIELLDDTVRLTADSGSADQLSLSSPRHPVALR
jgi:hypothetical protein